MVEWSITAVLKTVELRGSGGSNPSLSAKKIEAQRNAGLFLCSTSRVYRSKSFQMLYEISLS